MAHDDFAVEPIRGLPEDLPEGEVILWQGRPDTWALAWESMALPWVAGYFGVLALWRFVSVVDQMPLGQALGAAVPFVILAVIVLALLVAVAWIQGRAAVYTITNRRVVMRINAALTMTLNLPYRQIGNARLDLRKGGTGTIAFELIGDTRFSYVMLWPHVRPWHMRVTEPALRCIPDAERIAAMLAEAAQAQVSQPVIRRIDDMDHGGLSPVAAE